MSGYGVKGIYREILDFNSALRISLEGNAFMLLYDLALKLEKLGKKQRYRYNLLFIQKRHVW